MGLINGALQIGRSALMAYQSALQVVGNNISNVGTDGYTRQTPVLTPVEGAVLPEGFQAGGGVALTGLRRNVDETLEARYRVALGDAAGSLVQQQTLGRIESVMNELTDTDLSSILQSFFNSFSDLQNNPHDTATRGMVITQGSTLANEIQRQRTDVLALRNELNDDLEASAQQADQIATQVADLNVRIAKLESTGEGGANALRDQRDGLLRDLGELVRIEVREQPDGGVNVYVGNELLVQGGLSRGLTTTLDTTSGYPQVVVRFKDNNTPIMMRGGKMAGLVEARDTHLMGQIEQLDNLARALIQEVNKVHASGQGLEGFTDITGVFDVQDPDAALNSGQANLDLKPKNGSFKVIVVDQATGLSQTSLITVDLDGAGTDESLNSLVVQINGKIQNAQAIATGDNRLRFKAGDGFEIRFAEDTSNTLAALGVNTFFSGTDSQDLAVNPLMANNPRYLAAATSGNTGDGTNAASIAALGDTALEGLDGRSVSDFYNAIVANVAVKGAAASASVEATNAINTSLSAQRESISGVSLDEETISLLRMERSFQGAARYTTTVDQLLQEMLALVR